MMDPFKGVRVEVTCEESSLPLYDDPDLLDTDQTVGKHIRQSYVEAKTGAKFEIKITLDSQFPLPGHHHDTEVKVIVLFDNLSSYAYHTPFKEIKDRIHQTGSFVWEISDVGKYCASSNQWYVGKAMFKALTIGACQAQLALSRVILIDSSGGRSYR